MLLISKVISDVLVLPPVRGLVGFIKFGCVLVLLLLRNFATLLHLAYCYYGATFTFLAESLQKLTFYSTKNLGELRIHIIKSRKTEEKTDLISTWLDKGEKLLKATAPDKK